VFVTIIESSLTSFKFSAVVMKFESKFKSISLIQFLTLIIHAEMEDKRGPLSSESILP